MLTSYDNRYIHHIIDFDIECRMWYGIYSPYTQILPIPRLGGIAFIPSMMVAVLITFDFLRLQYHSQIIHINLSSLHVVVSLFVIYMTGIIDDLIGLNAPVKFTLQIISGVILTLAGFYLNNLYGLFGIYEMPQWLGSILTVFIIVFVCNALRHRWPSSVSVAFAISMHN